MPTRSRISPTASSHSTVRPTLAGMPRRHSLAIPATGWPLRYDRLFDQAGAETSYTLVRRLVMTRVPLPARWALAVIAIATAPVLLHGSPRPGVNKSLFVGVFDETGKPVPTFGVGD